MNRRWVPAICLNLSLLCQVLSIGFGKQAALSMAEFTFSAILANGWYLASIFCLVGQSLVWPLALRHYPLTFAYFYMSLTYAAILLMSWLIFAEPVSLFNLFGVMLIVCGVNLMVGGSRAASHV